jgi:hypothetical protein
MSPLKKDDLVAEKIKPIASVGTMYIKHMLTVQFWIVAGSIASDLIVKFQI